MKSFVFQSVPERYDLRQALKPGVEDTWYATRYRDEMHVGDLVFFWMAGNENFRGLYGWGHIISAPYQNPSWDSHGVDVRYEVKFKEPIFAKSFKNDPHLARLMIFRAPQATNFLLTPDQAHQLVKLIVKRGEKAPPENGGAQ